MKNKKHPLLYVDKSELVNNLLYRITIPQLGIAAFDFLDSTDMNDWAILAYIKRWESNKKAKKVDTGRWEYVWVNYNRLITSLPLIHILTKNSVSKRIRKLESLGLLDKYQAADNTIYLRLTELADSVYEFHTDGPDGVMFEMDSYSR